MSVEWASSSGKSSSGDMRITYDSNTGGSRWQFKETLVPNFTAPPVMPNYAPQFPLAPPAITINPEELLKDEAFVKKLGAALLKTLGKEQIVELIRDAPKPSPGRRVVRE